MIKLYPFIFFNNLGTRGMNGVATMQVDISLVDILVLVGMSTKESWFPLKFVNHAWSPNLSPINTSVLRDYILVY